MSSDKVSPIKIVGIIGAGRMGLPVIGHLAKKGFDVRVNDIAAGKRAEVEKLLSRLAHLPPQERALVESMASAIVNKLIHNTMVTLKSEVASADGAAFVEAARRFFNLSETGVGTEELGIEAPTRTSANKPG